MTEVELKKKIGMNMAILVMLFLLLAVSTYALFSPVLIIKDNIFTTASAPKVTINDGKKVFNEKDLSFGPGERIMKPMKIKNQSDMELHYRVYLENVKGPLEDVLIFNIYFNDQLKHSVKLSDFGKSNAYISHIPLKAGEERTYFVEAVFPVGYNNQHSNQYVYFDFVVNAVQAKNNPDKLFD